jgi:hypothetical protein
LDGYNWGTVKPWSRWRSFREIFYGVYQDAVQKFGKPVLITEFSTTSEGGDKARWIREALREIRKMSNLKGVAIFNVDKETDWKFSPGTVEGQALSKMLGDSVFAGRVPGSRE